MNNIIFAEFVAELSAASDDQVGELLDEMADNPVFAYEAGEEFEQAVCRVHSLFHSKPEGFHRRAA